MRTLAALFLLGHGFAHLPGFVGAFRLGTAVPYHTALLHGRLDVGDGGMRVMGALWLLAALLFAAVAVGLLAHAAWWRPLLVGTALLSLALSVLEWPAARVGVAVDVALLVGFGLSVVAGFDGSRAAQM